MTQSNFDFIEEAYKGNIQAIKELYKLGISVNTCYKDGLTALMAASLAGHSHIVCFLIENKANVNSVDSHGKNALMYAIKRKNKKIIEILIKNNIKLNIKEIYFHITPLMLAISIDDFDIVKTLIDNGANLEARDIDGTTALMKAAYFGNTKIIELLIESGANIESKDTEGNSFFDYAISMGHKIELNCK